MFLLCLGSAYVVFLLIANCYFGRLYVVKLYVHAVELMHMFTVTAGVTYI